MRETEKSHLVTEILLSRS